MRATQPIPKHLQCGCNKHQAAKCAPRKESPVTFDPFPGVVPARPTDITIDLRPLNCRLRFEDATAQ